jgi:hypothetical protein
MKTAQAAISKKLNMGKCSVTLSAVELPDLKLEVRITGPIGLRTDAGDVYLKDTIQVLCGSGLALARTRLELVAGLSVDVMDVSGTLNVDDEAGVCMATAVAIARAMGKEDAKVLLGANDWELSDK